ncbi:hypothetical protein MKX07_007408 [Trichoderma sp. CBMAI-0711]|nr:hypothetical protein MKX07_007408 [Trichoderma sp. CBMAI-0711]
MATTAATPSPPPSSSTPTAAAGTTKTTTTGFAFPREYSFPPFFTRQPNIAIHHAQLTKWSALVLSYARHHRLFRLVVSSAAESDLFYNRAINRRLGPADIREVLDFMRKDGRAEFIRASSSSSSSAAAAAGSDVGGGGGGGGAGGVAGDVVLLYWRKPEEWAALVEAYVDETAQKGSVLTVYELTEGENTRGTGTFENNLHGHSWDAERERERERERPQSSCANANNFLEFHGMDNLVLMKALNILVKQGKAQIFGSEDSLGVKFF